MNSSKSSGQIGHLIVKPTLNRENSSSRLTKPLKSMKSHVVQPKTRERVRVPLPETISLPRTGESHGRNTDNIRPATAKSRITLKSGNMQKTKTTLQPVSEIAEISNMDNDASGL